MNQLIVIRKKYVKLTGQIISIENDKLNVITDIENNTNEIIISLENKMVKLNKNDYISIDGYIKAADKKTFKLYIIADEVKIISYMDAVAPTTKEVILNKEIIQNNVIIAINKVEFSSVETRIYVNVTNNSNYDFNLYSYSSFLVQDNKQYETTYSKNSVDIASIILPNSNSSGVIVFPKINESNFTITIKGYSSNYNLNFENYTFDLDIN